MVVIPSGGFLMGSPHDEPGRGDGEGPQHHVTMDKPFAMSRGAITVREFRSFVEDAGYRTGAERGNKGCFVWNKGSREWERHQDCNWRNPGFHPDDRAPVVGVSWEDAMAYVKWLGDKTGKDYRLPSEAEWEYAARAGTSTPFSTGNRIGSDSANYDANYHYADCKARPDVSKSKIAPVGSLPANPWGLCEMHGNVWEWVADCWHESYRDAPVDGSPWYEENDGVRSQRVARGGGWNSEPSDLRSANRVKFCLDAADIYLGFRVARSLSD
uniref:Formylglycine-generating enzyme, required for sulfatase activity, contains SUMF1/FGE domain n=1 Tax=Candidatus Kentrum sp. LFY TaxID=2126342 RepID=A0A450WM87_9GAMM|nr:MAG: Formylglycine-generating enzyme, required for sulfatase activity, contains SUMF1/FGE domain [Candidatus Kentron sp. LFY]